MKSEVVVWWVLIFSVPAVAQSGGQFAVTQSVIANGGANSTNGNFGLTGTIAQTSVGAHMTGGNFGLRGGFWQPFFAPTAALVSVGGRITAADGSGIANVLVVMTNQAGESATALSNSF